jgi:hypothetical protein
MMNSEKWTAADGQRNSEKYHTKSIMLVVVLRDIRNGEISIDVRILEL